MNTVAAILGAAGGITVANIVTTYKNIKLGRENRGYRKAREDDHRRALEALGASPDPDASTNTGEDTGASEDLTPDVVEPIVGLRAWHVRHGGFLTSYGDFHWSPREAVTSRCGRRSFSLDTGEKPHAVPGKHCSCGIYAAKRELEIQYPIDSGPFAWGRVAIWGRVEESERGYRAQYGYPVNLTLVNCPRAERSDPKYGITTPAAEPLSDAKLEELRDALSLHYGIPVRIGTLAELDQARRGNYEAMGIPAEVKELVG